MTKETSPLANVLEDLDFLVANIIEPSTRTYLRAPVIEALQRIGHDSALAHDAANQFFHVTIN